MWKHWLNWELRENKADNRNKSVGNADKEVKEDVCMIFIITMLKELNMKENFGRQLETILKIKWKF